MNKMKSPKLAISNSNVKKRKQPDCDTDSLVFMDTAVSKAIKSPSPKKKKFKQFLQSISPKYLHVRVSPREERLNQESVSNDSHSSSSEDESNKFLDSLSGIYASDAEERVATSSDSNKLNLTGENFDEVMQDAEFMSDAETNESDNQYFLKKREKFVNQRKFKHITKKDKGSHPTVIPVLERGSFVVLLNHPSAITLHKYVSVEVLSGSVSICGHELHSRSMPVRVFSSEQTGLVELKTEGFDRIWMRKEVSMNLTRQLRKIINDKEEVDRILSQFGNNSVLIFIEGINYPSHLEFLKLYYPDVMKFKKKKPSPLCEYLTDDMWTVHFSSDAENLASEINHAIRYSSLHLLTGPRVVVFGPKNTGKSSLLRYLMNKMLSMFSRPIYYLDTDPGQAEFTPSGVVSLTEVKERVLGPPFCHQRHPLSMTFVGGVSADSPDTYSNGVAKMANLYKENYSEETLVVNTMGWVQGLGLECLKNTLKSVKPTILVELVTKNNVTMFDYRHYVPKKVQYYQICSPFVGRSSPNLSAKEMRNLSLLSYFGKCQPSYMPTAYLNSFQPYRVCWDKIPIYFSGKKVPPYRMIEAINGSIVALCSVDESLILESSIAEFPQTLEPEPDNECLGFGLVRAIDEVKHLLLIVSPLRLADIQRVNAIIKGNITVPPSVFVNQPVTGVPLPFTDYRSAASLHEEDSQKSKIFSKDIPKRYGKNVRN